MVRRRRLVSISRGFGKVVLFVHGPLADRTAALFRQLLLDVVDGQGNMDVVVALDDVDSIDDPSVEVLSHVAVRLRDRGGAFTLSGPQGQVRASLDAVGLVPSGLNGQ